MSMQDQITDFHPHLFFEEEPLDPQLNYTAYKNDDMRINIVKVHTDDTLIQSFEKAKCGFKSIIVWTKCPAITMALWDR